VADIRFDGRVVLVTGAGGGLGRSHALEFARRGAKVVVNDLGGAVDGSGGSSAAADAVVAEIAARGGQAIADGGSVTDERGVRNMVDRALAAFGRIDVLIANAGILRDKTFAKMELRDFDAVMDVHLMGTVRPLKAIWPLMREQGYGRVVVTTSSSGLYGNFGQSNYGAAKMALVGLMNTLRLEGERDGVRINAIAPIAATRMTEGLMPQEVLEVIRPEFVTPGVVYLASEEAPSGMILAAGAGTFAAARIYETEGVALDRDTLSAEAVQTAWDRIVDPAGQQAYTTGSDQTQKFLRKLAGG
jgi:NAD(P)-dependent dehydrogenase (short-subunit alcohol dehydrogenase family)